MLRSFSISNFRCIRELTLDMERINLIVGKNGVGKTTLLEALFVHLAPFNPDVPGRVNFFRGLSSITMKPEEIWGWLFPEKNVDTPVRLVSIDSQGLKHEVTLSLVGPVSIEYGAGEPDESVIDAAALVDEMRYRELHLVYNNSAGVSFETVARIEGNHIRYEPNSLRPLPRGVFLGSRIKTMHENAQRFSKLEETGKHEAVLDALKLMESRLRRLAVYVSGKEVSIRGDIGIGRLVPIHLMGGGVSSFLSILLAIAEEPGGVVLLDEIDNGLHYSVMEDIWKAIGEFARNNDTQVVATTHSWECVESAHFAFEDCDPYDFRLHRLDRIDGAVRVTTYDQETIDTSVEMRLEVR